MFKELGRILKRFMPVTLFGRSFLIIVTPVLLLQIIIGTVFIDNHWSRISSRLAFAVAGEVAIVVEKLEEDSSPESVSEISNIAVRHLDLLINYKKGAEIDPEIMQGSGWQSFVVASLAEALRDQLTQPFSIKPVFHQKKVEIAIQLEDGVLYVSALERRLFSSSSYIFLLWMVGTSLVLFAISLLFMRNQIRPIRRLAVAAARFGVGLDSPSFKPGGAREIRQASTAFIEMRDRIRRQISQRTAMLAGVSHDLRTPLTRLKLGLAMLEETQDTLALKSDIDEMERMIEGYLDFARGEGGEQSAPVDLVELLENVVSSIKRTGADISLSTAEPLRIPVRPMAFERCLTNLITNADKYAGKIWVSAYKLNADTIEITVDDNGPGLSETEYEDVFKPFYRVDHSRNTTTGGVGLGLPIAMDVVHAHGGKIWLEKSNHGGLRVVVHLPVWNADPASLV